MDAGHRALGGGIWVSSGNAFCWAGCGTGWLSQQRSARKTQERLLSGTAHPLRARSVMQATITEMLVQCTGAYSTLYLMVAIDRRVGTIIRYKSCPLWEQLILY